jgi:hypothetical protein
MGPASVPISPVPEQLWQRRSSTPLAAVSFDPSVFDMVGRL